MLSPTFFLIPFLAILRFAHFQYMPIKGIGRSTKWHNHLKWAVRWKERLIFDCIYRNESFNLIQSALDKHKRVSNDAKKIQCVYRYFQLRKFHHRYQSEWNTFFCSVARSLASLFSMCIRQDVSQEIAYTMSALLLLYNCFIAMRNVSALVCWHLTQKKSP